MPTLDDAFDAVRTALVDHFGPAADEFEGLDAVRGDGRRASRPRDRRQRRWKPVSTAWQTTVCSRPSGWPRPRSSRSPTLLRNKASRPRPGAIAPLKHLARWLVDQGMTATCRGCSIRAQPESTDSLRDELAAIKGIGPAAADADPLFALKRPSYPVDRATFRVLVRHGWLDPTATYDEARDLVVERAVDRRGRSRMSRRCGLLGELSHGMEQLGRQFCRAAAPHCERCPLERFLPEGGPREVDA